jgi:hypothetical protein
VDRSSMSLAADTPAWHCPRRRTAVQCPPRHDVFDHRDGPAHRVEEDGAIRLGLMYVNGLRRDMGQALAAIDRTKALVPPPLCAKCGCDDESMIETIRAGLSPETALPPSPFPLPVRTSAMCARTRGP